MTDIYQDKEYLELIEELRNLRGDLPVKLVTVIGKAVQHGISVLADRNKKCLERHK
jgi:CxxC motif-containing protein